MASDRHFVAAVTAKPWRRRVASRRLRAAAEAARLPDVQAGLLHLADLYAGCTKPYPEVEEPPEELLLFPWRHLVRPTFSSGGSPAQACLER